MSRFASILSLILIAFSLSQCKNRISNQESALTESEISQYKHQINLFNKIMGRQPTGREVKPMKSMSLSEQVDYLMNMDEFKKEAFFQLHKDRLMLNPEIESKWLKNSRNDFCSLKWAFQEMAEADLNGEGYWQVLRHRKIWFPGNNLFKTPQSFKKSCSAFSLAELNLAIKEANVNNLNDLANQNVKQCLTNISYMAYNFKDAPFIVDSELDIGKFSEFIESLSESDKSGPTTKSYALLNFLIEPSLNGALDVQRPANLLASERRKVEVRTLTDPNACDYQSEEIDIQDLFAASQEEDDDEGDNDEGDEDESEPPPPRAEVATKFLPIELDKIYAGVHGHPYYLNRHFVDYNNRNLHRGRMIFFSYFCSNINPDAANENGIEPKKIAELEKYFDESDQHVNKSANCYDCHTRVQPVANFFDASANGRNYKQEGRSSIGKYGQNYKPGGYWNGKELFPLLGEPYGTDGLANLLSTHPLVKSCLVDHTWSLLVGSNHPLGELERDQAIQAFTQPTARLSQLIKHLVAKNERGQIYFTQGEETFAKVKIEEELDCTSSQSEGREKSFIEALATNCAASCHINPFTNASGQIDVALYHGNLNGTTTSRDAAQLYKDIYCQVKTGQMPARGSGITLSKKDRESIICESESRLTNLLKDNVELSDFNKQCLSGVPSMDARGAHAITQ